MKILYFSPRACWPLTTGARLRDYHLASQLSQYAEVTFLGLYPSGTAPDPEPPSKAGFARNLLLENDPAYTLPKLLRGVTGPHPVTVLNYTSPRLVTALSTLLRENHFDSVQIEGVHLVHYVDVIRKASPNSAVVADWHNVESEILLRYAVNTQNPLRSWFARRTAHLMRSSERILLAGCDAHTVTSEREQHELQRESHKVTTIPNGVDIGFYQAIERRPAETPILVFVGSMDYHANIDAVHWFVRESWPLLRRSQPSLRFQVVGRNPPASIQALAGDGIEVTGAVEDVRPFYASAAAAVVPLRVGGGTRLKILEAMAAGVPVVSTTLGAEGLHITDHRDILIADSPADLAETVSRLLQDPGLGSSIAQHGSALVSKSYGWAQLGLALFQVHQEALHHRSRQASNVSS